MVRMPAIERYDCRRVIGKGQLGAVYEAVDRGTSEVVVVKRVDVSGLGKADILGRFDRIAARTSDLDGMNVTHFRDHGKHNQIYYTVREYVEGKGLDGALNECDDERSIEIICNAATILHEAHQQCTYHAGIKLGNIIVGSNGQVTLTDFLMSHEFLSHAGSYGETLNYMSPAVFGLEIGDNAVDHKVDIYSMGMVLFYALTRTLPFDCKSPAEMISILGRVITHPAESMDSFKRLDDRIQSIISRAIAGSNGGYSSLEGFVDDLRGYLTGQRHVGDVGPGNAPVAKPVLIPIGPETDELDEAYNEGFDDGLKEGSRDARIGVKRKHAKRRRKGGSWLPYAWSAVIGAVVGGVIGYSISTREEPNKMHSATAIKVEESEAVDALKKRIEELDNDNRNMWERYYDSEDEKEELERRQHELMQGR